MTEQQIREKISTILVKHNMPTRQIAITEIVNLFTQEREELEKKIDKMMKPLDADQTIFKFNTGEEVKAREEFNLPLAVVYNSGLQDIKALLKEQ